MGGRRYIQVVVFGVVDRISTESSKWGSDGRDGMFCASTSSILRHIREGVSGMSVAGSMHPFVYCLFQESVNKYQNQASAKN